VSERDLRRRLASVTPPDEAAAEQRAWAFVRAAFDEREPVRWPRRHWRAVAVAAAAALIVVSAAFTKPVRAVIDDVREAIGIERTRSALFSLPAQGRLLVDSQAGVWVVSPDGSKRLLPGYREGSWSPYGAYVVVSKRNQLAALEPDGEVHWTLARRDIRFPRWGGTRTDTRIAYVTDPKNAVPAIRVVGGDGQGDHWLAKDFVDVAPAWRPGGAHVLAVAHVDGRIRLWRADDRALLATSARGERPIELAWSNDGSRLFVLSRRSLRVLGPHARRLTTRRLPAGSVATGMALAPDGRTVALARSRSGQSEIVIVDHGRERRVLAGEGAFSGVEWSPDGRWLLVAWNDANQWVFIPSTRGRHINGFSNIEGQFESAGSFPALAGWCCPD
jgi:dipeptidyl aminopeptidase/acylaminoacyl peptidase